MSFYAKVCFVFSNFEVYCKSGNFCGTFIFALFALNLVTAKIKTRKLKQQHRKPAINLATAKLKTCKISKMSPCEKITPAKISTFRVFD